MLGRTEGLSTGSAVVGLAVGNGVLHPWWYPSFGKSTLGDMRRCGINDTKFYQVRTKIIALGCYWVTMTCLGQINPKIHCSPDMHNVQAITKNILYKSMKACWKWTIFGSFMVQFLLIPCFCSHISLKNKLYAHTLYSFLTLSAF